MLNDIPCCSELVYRYEANEFVSLYSSGCPDMDKEMIPKFASKDEEVDYWKSQALKYKKRYVYMNNVMSETVER